MYHEIHTVSTRPVHMGHYCTVRYHRKCHLRMIFPDVAVGPDVAVVAVAPDVAVGPNVANQPTDQPTNQPTLTQ